MSIIEKVIEKAGRNEKDLSKQAEKDLLDNKNSSKASASISQPTYKAEPLDVKVAENESVDAKIKASEIFKINRKKLSEQGFLCFDHSTSQLSEEYRMIKRPLINNALKSKDKEIKRGNLILITSSKPGEGKTFTAINLALSIASERDKKVLLIDADVAKPSVSKVLGIEKQKKGLIDYLDGKEQDFSQIMIKTDVNGLTIVPSGSKHGYSTELLASERMASLVEELHSRYPDRIVIFDSPPLLATTQAEVLASLVGQVVLVIESEGTLQSMVNDSTDKLKDCDVVMVLLNKLTHTVGMNHYGYGQYGH